MGWRGGGMECEYVHAVVYITTQNSQLTTNDSRITHQLLSATFHIPACAASAASVRMIFLFS